MTDVDINIERPRFPLRSDCDHDLYVTSCWLRLGKAEDVFILCMRCTCLQTKPIQCDNDTRFWSIHPCVAIEGFSVLQHYRFVKFRIAVHIVYSLTYIYRVLHYLIIQ